MVRFTTVGLLVAQGLVTSLALAQTGASKPVEPAPRSGYKVAFCYDRSRPAQSLRYQVYDLSKRQYDHQAVGRWLDLVKSKFPGHTAYVKDVSTVREPGKDEEAALMAVIEQEKQEIRRMARTDSGTPPTPNQRAVATEPEVRQPRQESSRPPVTSDVSRPIDFGRLMHPSISGYSPTRSTGRSSLGSPLSGSSRFGYAPSSPSSPFPYPYPRPHP